MEIDPHKAVEYLIEHSKQYAKAKADRVYLEQFRKSKKALLMNQCEEKAANAREQYAYSHPEYVALLDGLREAVAVEEALIWRLRAAQMRVEVWRSQEATNRRQDAAAQ